MCSILGVISSKHRSSPSLVSGSHTPQSDSDSYCSDKERESKGVREIEMEQEDMDQTEPDSTVDQVDFFSKENRAEK